MFLTDLLPILQELSSADKLKVMQFLKSELDREELESMLEHGKTYPIWSPYDAFEAADILGKMLEEHNKTKDA